MTDQLKLLNKIKLISIVMPVFNEEENISLMYKKIKEIFSNLNKNYDHEIIFVNDGSSDKSAEIIENLLGSDRKIKYIEFSRNFGKEIATSAGIYFSSGDVVIIIDADLQHPPELIPEFINKWENGADVVIGVREKTSGEGIIKKLGSKIFYKIMNLIGEIKFTAGETDYRLIDKKIVIEFNKFTERNRITRGLIDWLGFKKNYIKFTAGRRMQDKPRYSYIKLVRLAFSSFVSNSFFLLRLAGYLGIGITLFSGIFGLFIIIEYYILNDPMGLLFSGPAQLAVLLLFLIGIVLVCLGLIALYIGNIHNEVMNRPIYVIKKKKNL